MKIALLTDGIQPYVIGGMQRHSFFIAKYLALNNIYVDLYHTTQNKDENFKKINVFTEAEKKYIRSFVIDFPQKDVIPSVFSPLLLKSHTEIGIRLPGHYLRRSFLYSERIFEVLKNNLDGVDFIYCKGFTGWKLIGEKVKGNLPSPQRGRHIPIAVKFHGLNMFQKPPSFKAWFEQFMFRSPVKFNIRHADYVFSYGGKITDITKKIGVPEKKIIEIPTGIESSWIRDSINKTSKNSKIRFLYVGRYERVKGIQELSEAIRLLQVDPLPSSVPFSEFHFIGPIPEHLQIRNQSRAENRAEVFYHGQISSGEEIKKIMDSSDVLVLPSYSEGMPNVIIEAMARGMAIIATDVGAINCLVSAENGFLLEQCSVKNIRHAMIKALNLPAGKLDELKNNSIRKIKEDFLWENVAGKLISEIERVVEFQKT